MGAEKGDTQIPSLPKAGVPPFVSEAMLEAMLKKQLSGGGFKPTALLHMKIAIYGEHFGASLVVFCPEAQRYRTCTHTQILQSDVREPPWQNRIYIKHLLVPIGMESKNGSQKVKHAT